MFGEWQPIDSAPRDGTKIIIGRNFGHYYFIIGEGWWIDPVDLGNGQGHDGGFMHYSGQGFFPGNTFGPDYFQHPGCQPSHWMPLPHPPEIV